jgi:FAD/FMN-containing dehydrogenase
MGDHIQDTSRRDQKRQRIVEAVAEKEQQWRYWQALHSLATQMRGEVVLPEEPEFESARTVWNAAIDRHPALIARCASPDDVIAAVTFARVQGLAVSVRSGGHSMAGHGTNDGGIVIDLSPMKAIAIDPLRQTARIEAGLTWGEVAQECHPHGLALTSGDASSVGVGGLILGGGIGWMVRKYGLTLDRLRAVEVVTADGQFVRASADEHAELFWGLRGGGGNFGIATAFEVDVHPAGTVLGGAVFYDAAEAERILQAHVSYTAAAPDELSTEALLMAAPPAPIIPPDKQGKPVVLIMVCYTGDLAEGERVVAPLRTLGTPIADVIAPMPYPGLFALTEASTLHGFHYDVRALFLKTLGKDMLHTLVEASLAAMSAHTLVKLCVLGGQMSRVESSATAFAHRDKAGMLVVMNYGQDPADAEGRHARTEHVWQAMRPYVDGVYINYLGDEGQARIHEAYPKAVYARLAALKQRYDPTNLFHLNQNILPKQ